MAKTLNEFTQQAMEAYAPAKQALQNQLDALSGQLAETEAGINRQFANQQKELDTQRQTASSVASMQAAGSGGSFGGKANIANRNYYRDAFVPAVARLQTNQANALGEARRQNQNQRLSLQSQLANLLTQANTSSISRYDDWNRFDQNMAWDKDKFNQNMAWDKDKFGQTMSWDKEKFNRQMAEARAARASGGGSDGLSGLLQKVFGGGTGQNSSSSKYFSSGTPIYVKDPRGNTVYNFGAGIGGPQNATIEELKNNRVNSAVRNGGNKPAWLNSLNNLNNLNFISK